MVWTVKLLRADDDDDDDDTSMNSLVVGVSEHDNGACFHCVV